MKTDKSTITYADKGLLDIYLMFQAGEESTIKFWTFSTLGYRETALELIAEGVLAVDEGGSVRITSDGVDRCEKVAYSYGLASGIRDLNDGLYNPYKVPNQVRIGYLDAQDTKSAFSIRDRWDGPTLERLAAPLAITADEREAA